MRKNLLKNFAINQEQFREGFECSSIRLNAEDQNEVMEPRVNNRNIKENKAQAKRYEQNSLNGLEQSLMIQSYQENILDLMRSKSAAELGSKEQKQASQKQPKIGTQYVNSLYNTSSFDEMTMKMSIAKTNNNISQLNNFTNFTENQEVKKLKKPQEMQKYKVTYSDNQMNIMINEIKRDTEKTPVFQSKIQETRDQRGLKEKKPSDSTKNQQLLASLRCSQVESQHSQNLQESFQQPYFKPINSSQLLKQDLAMQSSIRNQGKQTIRRPDIHVVIPTVQESPYKKQQAGKVANKKLTLRDYIHLNQLATKPMDKDSSSSTNNSPLTPMSDRRASFARKKKTLPSNNEVIVKIKHEIANDLKLIQNNINILSEYFSTQNNCPEAENQQIMRLYTISRMIKQRMLVGNDEIIKFLKDSNQKP